MNLAEIFAESVPRGIARLAAELNLSESEIVKAALVRGLASIDAGSVAPEAERRRIVAESCRPVVYLDRYVSEIRANGHG